MNILRQAALLFVLPALMLFVFSARTQAAVWDDAVSFYENFGNDTIQFRDGFFYYGSRGSAGSVEGIRYAVSGQTFALREEGGAVYTVTVAMQGEHKKGTCKRISYRLLDGYRYSLYRISYQKLYKKLREKYPETDFSAVMYNHHLTIQISFLLCLSVAGENQGSLSETSGGDVVIQGTVYSSLKEILQAAAWSEPARESLKGYFDLSMNIYQPSSYSVVFCKNQKKAVGSMEKMSLEYGRSYRLPACGYQYERQVTFSAGILSGQDSFCNRIVRNYPCDFLGWSENSLGEVRYLDQQMVCSLTDRQGKVIYLYACWDVPSVTLPDLKDSGLNAQNQENFRLVGWSRQCLKIQPADTAAEDLKGVLKPGSKVKLSRNMTYYAVWARVQKKVVFTEPGENQNPVMTCIYSPARAKLIRQRLKEYWLSLTGHDLTEEKN